MRRLFFILACACACALSAPIASANTSHDGWPSISGMLLMNKNDDSRPLDARPGHDPFAGEDEEYSCDEVHLRGDCQRRILDEGVVSSRPGHNELLGGHGSDTIHAGPWGDVIWGDYKPSGQPTSQRDRLYGGAGRDYIYASHGWNLIHAGGGDDWIKAHFGRGSIDCGGGLDTLYISRKAQRHYTIHGCERISHRTLGY
jgi:Ca2+-binding RTX toxin-like protein